LSQIQKLVASIVNNPKDVRFDDACKVAEHLGFTGKGRGGTSHHVFARPLEPLQLNFQRGQNGKIKPYHARQLIEMIEKYGDMI
jgi:hypothetical protein